MFHRLALFTLLALPTVVQAQSFPQIAVGGNANSWHFVTIVQMVNNNSSSTTAHAELISDAGTAFPVLIDGAGPQSTADITLSPGASRQLRLTRTGTLVSGWLRVTYSNNQALTAVLLQYRNGNSLVSEVGVDPVSAATLSTDFGVENGPVLNTGLALGNPSSSPSHVLAQLWDPTSGTPVARAVMSLAANGHKALFVTELFPGMSGMGPLRAKISLDSCTDAACTAAGGNGFVATALRYHHDQFTTIPVAPRTTVGEQVRVLPQVAFGGSPLGLNMKTLLYFTTNEPGGVTGTADLFDNDGNPLLASVNGAPASSSTTFTVPGGRVTRLELSGDAQLRSGWARLTLSDSLHMVTSGVFQTFVGQALESEAGVSESAATQKGLIQMRLEPGVDVGVAVANSDSSPAIVSLDVYNEQGNIFARRDITLSANGHLARFVTELFPQLTAVPQFTGSLAVHSSGTFSPMALRLTGGKLATLPISPNGMHRPAITSLRITQVQGSLAQVSFAVDVTDADADVATARLPVFAVAWVNLGPGGVEVGGVSMDGNPILNRQNGTLAGTLQLANVTSVPAGTSAVLNVLVYDALANTSNTMSIPFTF